MKKANLILGTDFIGRTKIFNDITYYFDNDMNELGYTSTLDDITGYCMVCYGRIWDKNLFKDYLIKDVIQ